MAPPTSTVLNSNTNSNQHQLRQQLREQQQEQATTPAPQNSKPVSASTKTTRCTSPAACSSRYRSWARLLHGRKLHGRKGLMVRASRSTNAGPRTTAGVRPTSGRAARPRAAAAGTCGTPSAAATTAPRTFSRTTASAKIPRARSRFMTAWSQRGLVADGVRARRYVRLHHRLRPREVLPLALPV